MTTPTITLDEVLLNNRFAVLATHDATRPQVHPDRCLYHLQPGKERMVGHVVPNIVPMTGVTATFFGQCYNCHYQAHSQKHCPLRYCSRCNSFGHSSIVCPTNTDS